MQTETPTKPSKGAAILMILDAIIESVKVAGSQGAPGGILYSALNAHGMSLGQFQTLMNICVESGRLRRNGQLYFFVQPIAGAAR